MIETILVFMVFLFPILSDVPKSAYTIVREHTDNKQERIALYRMMFQTRFYYIIPAIGILLGQYGKLFAAAYLMGFIASGSIERVGVYLRKLETE